MVGRVMKKIFSWFWCNWSHGKYHYVVNDFVARPYPVRKMVCVKCHKVLWERRV